MPDRVPSKIGLERDDWTNFIRNEIKLSFIRLDASLEPAFRKFINSQYDSTALFNKEHRTSLSDLDAVQFPASIEDAPYLRKEFEAFIKSPEYCQIECIRIFRLPGTYKILMFFMATMAFPSEVTMIPGFLLLKRFPPFWPIIIGVPVTVVMSLISEKWKTSIKEKWRALISLTSGLVAGTIIVPAFGPDYATTSLLNNFAAFVLLGTATGFTDFGSHSIERLYRFVFRVHDGAHHNSRSEDVDYNGLDLPAPDAGQPVGSLCLSCHCSHTYIHHICSLSECYYEGDCRANGKMTICIYGFSVSRKVQDFHLKTIFATLFDVLNDLYFNSSGCSCQLTNDKINNKNFIITIDKRRKQYKIDI